MPKIAYKDIAFRAGSLARIDTANQIIAAYQAQGFRLTLRQLYYQHVARGLIPNNDKEYDNLGSLINDARLAGLIDWDAIEDRTRNMRQLSHWSSPRDIINSAAASYHVDMWENQPFRPEVWVEKDALVGVLQGVCNELDVPYFSCRGYTSQSEMWAGAMRLCDFKDGGQTPYIFHLGDHDPSGQDMSRDIRDRMAMFGARLEFDRLALNFNQVQQYQPPPNPAKLTDSRATGYIAQFGYQSWELDALEPRVIADLIRVAVTGIRDRALWAEREAAKAEGKRLLDATYKRWSDVVDVLVVNTPADPDGEEEAPDDEDEWVDEDKEGDDDATS